MTDSFSESALVKPFRNIIRAVGAVFDAVYYFFQSLVNPSPGNRYSQGRVINQGRSGGARINTLRPPGSGVNAPNMSIGGCRSCQM